MPHYYFHVRRGQITVLDHEGSVLADDVDAELEGAQRAQRLACGEAMNGVSTDTAPSGGGAIIVADDNWKWLFEFPF